MLVGVMFLSGCNVSASKETEAIEHSTQVQIQDQTTQSETVAAITSAVQTSTHQEFVVNIKDKIENSSNEFIEIKLQYPVLEILNNKAAQEKFNAIVDSKIASVKASAKEIEGYAKDAKKQGLLQNPYYTAVEYELNYNKNNLIAITLKYSDYSGGAHGVYSEDTINFDILEAKQLTINDLFNDENKTTSMELINSRLKQEFSKVEGVITPFDGIKSNAKFKLMEQGVEIYFDLYEYTAYAYGIPRFIISYSDFGQNLKYRF